MTQSNVGGTNYQVQTDENNTNFYGGKHTHNYPPTPDAIVGVPQNLPFSGTAKFVGRDEVLKQVQAELLAGSRLAITAIQGMGGVGKTELALQYALKFSEEYPGGICWLRGRQEISTQIIGFGESRLNLQIPDWLDDAGKRVAWCWQHWRSGKVLLIVDDVVDYGAVKGWLPQNDARFQVLMTTRESLGAGVQRLELAVLSDGAALELLESLIGAERLQAEWERGAALCTWVGNLPLGVELVGRYLAGKLDLSLAEMLERLQQKRLDAPAIKGATAEMTAQLGVREAFELSWLDLDTAAQEVAGLLSIFAVAPIPWQLIEACLFKRDQEDLETIRDEQLVFLHLLQRVDYRQYQLHPLVREFFGDKLVTHVDADKLRMVFVRVMTEIAQTIPGTPTVEIVRRVELTIPHLAEATRYTYFLPKQVDPLFLFTGQSRFWESQNLWERAEEVLKNCLQFSQISRGDQHPDTANSLNNLAELYRTIGQYERAVPLYESALEICRSELGDRHPDTAASLNNLALLYESMGQYERALPLFESALEIFRSKLGDRHPATANSLNNLALLYSSMGQYERALPLYELALEIRRSELGDRHPDTANSLNNLAGLYESMGQYERAVPLVESALEICRSELGDCHPATANSLNNLALLYESMGQYERALPLHESALEIRRSKLGDRHPNTAGSLFNLAALYYNMQQYHQALSFIQQALQIYIPTLGEDHPTTQSVKSWLQSIQEQLGKDESISYLSQESAILQAIPLLEKSLGVNHPITQAKRQELYQLRANM